MITNKRTNWLKLSALAYSVLAASNAYSLEKLDDAEMAEYTGQSIIGISQIAAGGVNPNPNVSFTQLKFNLDVELNANIKELKLGCGNNTQYTADCDVNIEDIAFTGIVPTGRANVTGTHTNAGIPSDFKLTNPFIELAIEQQGTDASTKKLVGFRVGAEETLGMMSFGRATYTTIGTTTTITHTGGIKSLSGHLPVVVSRGTVAVNAGIDRGIGYTKEYAPLTTPNNGDIGNDIAWWDNNRDLGNCVYGQTGWFSDPCNAVEEVSVGPLFPYNKHLLAYRQQFVKLDNQLTRGNGYLELYLVMEGLANLVALKGARASIVQDLSKIHEIKVAKPVTNASGQITGYQPSSTFGISAQSKPLVWQNGGIAALTGANANNGFGIQTLPVATDANERTLNTNFDYFNPQAQPGWWMALPQTNISNWSGSVSLPADAVFNAIFRAVVEIDNVELGQNAVDNCWGTRVFC